MIMIFNQDLEKNSLMPMITCNILTIDCVSLFMVELYHILLTQECYPYFFELWEICLISLSNIKLSSCTNYIILYKTITQRSIWFSFGKCPKATDNNLVKSVHCDLIQWIADQILKNNIFDFFSETTVQINFKFCIYLLDQLSYTMLVQIRVMPLLP